MSYEAMIFWGLVVWLLGKLALCIYLGRRADRPYYYRVTR